MSLTPKIAKAFDRAALHYDANALLQNEQLEQEMFFVQKVVSSGHALRKEHKIKVRQPLARAHMVSSDPVVLAALRTKENLITEELNVKEIIYHKDESAFVALLAKPNFRVLGKKVGGLMNAVQKNIALFGQEQLQTLLQGKEIVIDVEGEKIILTPEDVSVERRVLEGVVAESLEGITVALDTALTEALIEEGFAREMVNKINLFRKELDFLITDRISLKIKGSPVIQRCVEKYKGYICREVLAKEVLFVENLDGLIADVNGESVVLSLHVL